MADDPRYEEARSLLAGCARELADEEIVLRSRSDEKTVWAVGDRHVLRRANSNPMRGRLAREGALLRLLRGRTTLSIPAPVFVAEDGAFDLLRRAEGEPVDPNHWPRLDPASQRGIARQFGRFLAELHAAVDLEQARSLGYTREAWPPSPEWVADRLAGRADTPERARLVAEVLEVAPRLYDDALPPVLLHDDFSHHNVGFAPDGRRVLGVFDFTDVRLGDPHRDLRYAYTFEPCAEVIIAEYEARRGVALDRDRLRAWHAWSALGALASEIGDGEPERLAFRWGWVDHVAGWDRAYLRAIGARG